MLDIFAFLLLGAATFAAFKLIGSTVDRSGARSGSGWRSTNPRSRAWAGVIASVLGIPLHLSAEGERGGAFGAACTPGSVRRGPGSRLHHRNADGNRHAGARVDPGLR